MPPIDEPPITAPRGPGSRFNSASSAGIRRPVTQSRKLSNLPAFSATAKGESSKIRSVPPWSMPTTTGTGRFVFASPSAAVWACKPPAKDGASSKAFWPSKR